MGDGGGMRRWRVGLCLFVATTVMMMATMITATFMADGSSSSSQVETEQVRCWKVQSDLDGAPVQVLSTFTSASCAVSADFPLVSMRFAPNETIPVFWTVRLLTEAQTTNDLQMKNPPVAVPTLAADHVGQPVQIAATNVRVCASRSLCDPTTASVVDSTLQSGNFSTTGGSVLFQSLDQLSVAAEGSYVLAAQVRVVDDEDPMISYYYAAFSDITVATKKKATIVYDKRTTYCRRSAQSALATTLLASSSIERSSSCEIQVVVNSADVTQPNTSLAVSWTANLTRDSTKELRFPTPLTTVDVNLDRKYYEIVSSTIRVCKKGIECDEYSADDSGEIETGTGETISYGNFSVDGIARFTLTDIKLPTTGIYGAFAHLVLAAPNSRRFDTATYFQIVVTEENVGAQVSKEQYESGSSYCWEVVGAANATSTVATTSVMAMAKNSECPYAVEMALSTSSSISVTDSVSVSWKVKQQSAYSESKFSNGVTITTVHDTATNSFVNLPQSTAYYCNETLCTPFSTQKQLAFAASATNFTAGEASFTSSNFMFPTAGNYTLFVHAVIPNGDNFRFDAAAFAKVSVAAPIVISGDKSGSNVGTILGIVAGCIGGVLLILFAVVATRRYLAKKRRAPITKAAVFGFRSHTLDSPEHGDMPTASRESGSDASMSFMYVKAAPSPIEDVRANSLSYDPYSRPSFNDLSMDDANYTFALPEGELEEPTSEPPAQQQTHRF